MATMSRIKIKRITFFDIVVYALLTFTGIITFFPFYHVVVTSFVSFSEYLSKDFVLFPSRFVLTSYEFIFTTPTFLRSLRVTAISTAGGTLISMVVTMLYAYPLSKGKLKFIRFFSWFIIIPMMFSGGLIPYYFIVRDIKIINTVWALILPGCISTFNIILMKNFFQSLPESLEESAKLDGANDLTILFRIVFPLSMPIIATIGLFYAVGYWNDYMRAVLFISKSELYPLQNLLRQILIDNSLETLQEGMSYFSARAYETSYTIKMAIIVVATVPILCIYPFLQKYYVRGIMLGAVKS